MHVEFKKVVLHNFMSFGDATLCFNDDGFIRVSGVNENPQDNAGSNGSGKSSLWEAIIWAITGETIRGTKHVTNLYGDDGCFVELEFNIDRVNYRIIRSKDHKVLKTSLQIFVDGADVSGKGIRDSEKILQQYLPDLTSSLLGSVIILGQGLPQKFTSNTPSGRKEVLEKLSKSDFMIEDLKARVATRKSELNTELRSCEDNLVAQSAQKTFLLNQISQCEETLKTLDVNVLTNKSVEAKIHKSTNDEFLKRTSEELDVANSDVLKLKEQEALILTQQSSELNESQTSHNIERTPYQNHLNELQAQLRIFNNELTRVKNIKDVCPTCGQKISGVHKPDTTELELNIQTTSERAKDVSLHLNMLDSNHESSVKLIQEKYREKKKTIAEQLYSATEKLNSLNNDYKEYLRIDQTLTSQINELDKQLSQLQTTIDINNKIINDNKVKLVELEELFLYNNTQRDLAQSHLDVVGKFDTALKRDFRGFLLSTVIQYIQVRAMQYSKVIFDNEDIGFHLDGNNIEISYMNKAYENLSGGEKQKIDLIIQFSIRDMLSSQLNFTSNILVLDEVFDALDMIGCNRVIDMISNLSDVRNVFIVTHRKDLSIPSDKTLIVAKSSVGISEIRQ